MARTEIQQQALVTRILAAKEHYQNGARSAAHFIGVAITDEQLEHLWRTSHTRERMERELDRDLQKT